MSKTKLFIEKSRAKHGDRYGYDRVVYVRNIDKIIITCKQHGDFEQTPASHLRGSGCAKCGYEETAAKKTQKGKDGFIEKARAVHGNRYDYGRAVYVRNKYKVAITCAKHGVFEQTPENHLSGQGCAKCGLESIAAKATQKAKDSFIEKACAIHGDKYDYLNTVYVHSRGKVIITCTKHGDFEQTPFDHLAGKGCAKCGFESMTAKQTQKAKDGFIDKARAVHGDRYDYTNVEYVGAKTNVSITCANHGDFEQTPNVHLNGSGCTKCGYEEMATKQSEESKNSFIERSRAVHGDRYSYDRVAYVRSGDKVIITCKQHGDFEQIPASHLSGVGCTKCGRELTSAKQSEGAKDNFIEKSRAIHGERYVYSKAVYVRSKSKVVITCKVHGDFEQRPNDHLRGVGCPSCPKRFDQPANLYLMHNGIGKVKVGYSIDTDKRIKELNSNAPFKAELLESWTLPDTPTVRKIESKVHRKLAKYHAGLSGFDGASEWFNTSPERAKGAIIKALMGAEVLGHSEADSLQLSLI